MSELNEVKAVPEPKPTARLQVSREQAKDLQVGGAIRLEIAGEVREISQCYNDKEKYEIVLEDPIVKNVSEAEVEKEDDKEEEDDLAEIDLAKLKKMISKAE